MHNQQTPLITQPRQHRGFDSPQQEAFLNLWRTYDRLRALEDEFFSQHELSAQQYNTLRLLRATAPGTMPTLLIAERLVSRAPDITRLLDRLESRGLVVRERRPDNRRVVEVGITPAGCKLLDEMAGGVVAVAQAQLGHLTKEQLSRFTELLELARGPHEAPHSPWLCAGKAHDTTAAVASASSDANE